MKNIVKLALGLAAATAVYKVGQLSGVMNGANAFMNRSDDDVKANRMTVETNGLKFTVEKPDEKPTIDVEL